MVSHFIRTWTELNIRVRLATSSVCRWIHCAVRSILHMYWRFASSVPPFWLLLSYYVGNSLLGFVLLKNQGLRAGQPRIRSIDLFFTAVSASTVSSMATVQMEDFSRGQAFVLILLMLAGGDAVTSLLRLHLTKARISGESRKARDEVLMISQTAEIESQSINLLSMVVFGYFVGMVSLGFITIKIYLASGPAAEAREILSNKGIPVLDFAAFLSVSSFTNCGFVLTNESMMPFKSHPGLLLLSVFLVLAGNILFPPCLRGLVWSSGRLFKGKRAAADYLLCRGDGLHLDFQHLFGKRRCVYLAFATLAILSVQIFVFVSMEWNSDVLRDVNMSGWEKTVAVLFQSVNARHAGESIFDMSTISPTVLVLYVVTMYCPPYTYFSLTGERDASRGERPGSRNLMKEPLVFPHLGYISVFVMAICVAERRKFAQDPLNFNVFSVVFEVVSAYGNVGLSMGYQCAQRLTPDVSCKDKWYAFAGWWGDGGKMVLICVMLVGRLKRHTCCG